MSSWLCYDIGLSGNFTKVTSNGVCYSLAGKIGVGGTMGCSWIRLSLLAVVATQSGCVGVPRLYTPASKNAEKTIAPKVRDIVEEITCELTNVSKNHLNGKPYIITATLTLQVNDEINFSPSLSFVTPLADAQTNRTYNQNLGIGGARERNFSSVFHFDSSELEKRTACVEDGKKLYRLDGNLGLAEIARDGVGVRDEQLVVNKLSPPNEASFASQVKFVVTRSVGALGPTWTLLSFKGPGGANGPLNGKALTTDTLIVAFSAKKTEKTAAELQLAATNRLIELLTRNAERAQSELDRKRAITSLARNNLLLTLGKSPQKSNDTASLKTIINQAEMQEAEAVLKNNQAQEELDRGKLELQAAQDAATLSKMRSNEEALDTNRSLTNTLILQNLSVQPR